MIGTHVWISQDSSVKDYVVNLQVWYHGKLRDEFLAKSTLAHVHHGKTDGHTSILSSDKMSHIYI